MTAPASPTPPPLPTAQNVPPQVARPAVPAAPPRPRRRHPILALLLVCIIFGAGTIVGAGATIVIITHRLRHLVQHPDELPDRLTARLAARLHLRPEQRERVHALLVEHQSHLTAIRRDVQPQVEHELDSLHTDIAQTLDPAQKQSWDALYGDLKTNWLPPLPSTSSSSNP